MFYLIVEMSAEPVVESGSLDITRGFELHGDPVILLVVVDVHGDMTHLGGPYKPVALQEPAIQKVTLCIVFVNLLKNGKMTWYAMTWIAKLKASIMRICFLLVLEKKKKIIMSCANL